MPRALKETGQFKTDKKRVKGLHRDHEPSGEYEGVRECHVEPDWLLIYDKEGHAKAGVLQLIRTGTHSDLF